MCNGIRKLRSGYLEANPGSAVVWKLCLTRGEPSPGERLAWEPSASVAGLGMLLLGGSLFPRWIALAQDSRAVLEWETKAGGKMAFEVASVKPTTEFRAPTFALDAGPSYKFTGGHFQPLCR